MTGRRRDSWDAPLYRVFEEITGPAGVTLHPRMVAAHVQNPRTGEFSVSQSWNDKKRIYTDLSTARTYKNRLAKEGRVARIFRYVQEEEVT